MKKILFIVFGIILASLLGIVFASNINQNVKVIVVPGSITIFSPIEGKIYDNRMVQINISMIADFYYFKYLKYSDNGKKFVTFCRNCNEYGYYRLRRKSFDDGFHKIIAASILDGREIYGYVNFTVDTKNPKIIYINARKGRDLGLFEIVFQEVNPISLSLNYGNKKTGYRNVKLDIKNACYVFRKNDRKCRISVNLEDYAGQNLEYWFNVTDISGKTNKFRTKNVKVDTSWSFTKDVNERIAEIILSAIE